MQLQQCLSWSNQRFVRVQLRHGREFAVQQRSILRVSLAMSHRRLNYLRVIVPPANNDNDQQWVKRGLVLQCEQ